MHDLNRASAVIKRTKYLQFINDSIIVFCPSILHYPSFPAIDRPSVPGGVGLCEIVCIRVYGVVILLIWWVGYPR